MWDDTLVSDVRRVRALVSGRVQGVSYRASAQAEARRQGLVGWVRNLADGRVELEVEGPADRVAGLLAWCERGPAAAAVAAVEVATQPVRGDEAGFAILR
jgi:acylphosphatase